MYRSKLFQRVFTAVATTAVAVSIAVYAFSVPLIQDSAYEIELNASRTILDNVVELASRIHVNLETQRAEAVEWHKRQLKNVIAIADDYITFTFARAERGEITMAEARRLVFDAVSTFRYGADDYMWITDYNSVLLSHPDPDFQGRDVPLDLAGQPMMTVMIDIARREGEGYHTYAWTRLGHSLPRQKISYFKDFPKWGFVLGTGVYLDDIDAEMARRKVAAIDELRHALRNVRIARTGYVYIFDAANNMIIHPNPNIEGTQFGELLNPVTNRPISTTLREVAGGEEPIYYKWDKPSDPGNYKYEKLTWVRHFKGFDWYIASSVYTDELRRSSETLANRILFISLALIAVASTLGYVASRRLVRPLNRLADIAARVRRGDLRVQSGIVRDDEIGTLAAVFDAMIVRLRDNFDTLDARVRERTAELESAQGALIEAEARQRLILDAMPAAIAYVGPDERLIFVNSAWAAMLWRDKGQLIGRPLAEAVGPKAYGFLSAQMSRVWAGEQVTFEYAFTDRRGRPVVTKNSLIPERGPEGTVVGQFVLSLDVTDEKETERQLVEAQRLKAVGQLAGGLAHDFNNLLAVIIGNLATAREKFADVPRLDQYLEPAQRAGRRGADITARLLAFARRQPLAPAPVEVCALVREAGLLLARSLPPGVTLTVPPEDRACWAYVDPGQLDSALVNLAFNARDAMAGEGALGIGVAALAITGPLQFDEPVAPGAYVEITVTDTGPGFGAEALVRAFEPFFTTKRQGSGLGLSMVYGFVKQSRGYIRIDSGPGGTTVRLLLPGAMAQADGARPAALPAPADWSGELALVVEDDADVRVVLRTALADLGFAVIEADSADEAMGLLESLDDVRLVLSDVMMPGTLSGADLARVLRSWRPEVAVVLVSGFPLEGRAGDGVLLRKPWTREELVEAIRQATHNRRVEGGAGA
ncbi:cache domain-containing protein [Novispirillum sp. DQ9]|uniref:cache domain-containing protein n=1 Tax=Novispirillum sp. DQ9 TaxID=3398612 RepID=UPI003C7CED8F